MSKQTDPIVQLALNVQLSIAKLDPLQETLKHVSQLCEAITGVAYPINLDEHRQSKQQHQQQQTERKVAETIQQTKRKPRRPRKKPKPIDNPLRKQIDAAYNTKP